MSEAKCVPIITRGGGLIVLKRDCRGLTLNKTLVGRAYNIFFLFPPRLTLGKQLDIIACINKLNILCTPEYDMRSP